MKRINIVKTTIAAMLFAVTASQGQGVILSDDFSSGTLDNWNWIYGEVVGDTTVVTDGSEVAQVAHAKALSRSGLGNVVPVGYAMARGDIEFKFKLLSTPAPDNVSFEVGGTHYGNSNERIYQLDLDANVTANDVWDAFRIIFNNTSSALIYDQGGGISGTVAAGSVDVWRNGTILQDDAALTPGANISVGDPSRAYGFLCNLNENDTTFRVDDVYVRSIPQTEAVLSDDSFGVIGMPFAYPETTSSGTNTLWFHEDGTPADIEISLVTIHSQSHPTAFSTTFPAPATLADPSPVSTEMVFNFDNDIAGLSHTETATGLVDIVWNEVGGASQTNTVLLQSTYSDPEVQLVLSPSDTLSVSFRSPATTATGTVFATYIMGQALTNVQISAIDVINESHTGSFTNITPLNLILTDPASNETFEIVFDNAVAGLAESETATGQVVVTWNELGSTNNTEVIAVSATRAPAAVMEMNFDTAPVINAAGFSPIDLNNFASLAGQWNHASSLTHSSGYLQIDSQSNGRAGFTLIEYGTAGLDDVGAVDTVALSSGLYKIDLTYETADTGGNWGIGAYALEDQDVYPAVVNNVKFDVGNPGSQGYLLPQAQGAAGVYMHYNGVIQGNADVAKTTGSIYVNVDAGSAVLFAIWGEGGYNVRIHDLIMTRVGDFEETPANTVLDARFGASPSLRSDYLYNVHNEPTETWTHAGAAFTSQGLEVTSGAANSRSIAMVTRSGNAGFDDVGAADTVALTGGIYTVSMDVTFNDTAGGDGSVSVWAFSKTFEINGGVTNKVILDLGDGTATPIKDPVLNGTAGTNLLARKIFTSIQGERLVFENLTVNDGEDVAIVWNGYGDSDFSMIDNVMLIRTADLPPVYTPYELWAMAEGLTGSNALMTADIEPDGMDNLLEWALGGDPEVSDAFARLPVSDVDGSFLDYVYNRRTNHAALGLSYTVETDADLVIAPGWSNINYTVSVGPVSGEFEAVTNSIDTSTAGPKYFIRLRVEQN